MAKRFTDAERQDALVLRLLKIPYAEIGGFLGCSSNTVRALVDSRFKPKSHTRSAAAGKRFRAKPEAKFRRKLFASNVVN